MSVIERFNNLKVSMPEFCSSDDEKWIRALLVRLPMHLRKKAIVGYSDVYKNAFDKEPVAFRKENAARNAANTRLRLFMDSVEAIINEKVSKPPVMKNIAA